MLIPIDVPALAGKKVMFRGQEVAVRGAGKGAFTDVDIALFSAGAEASLTLGPMAVSEGAVVIDNSSAWRMDTDVPLVVPEVNPEALDGHKGLIANPNCSTIQMVVAAKPIHDAYRIKRIVVSTPGSSERDECRSMNCKRQAGQFVRGKAITAKSSPADKFNALPQIDVFLENGYTKKREDGHETHNILDPEIEVCTDRRKGRV